jgi:SAM-dependent methyltransferase
VSLGLAGFLVGRPEPGQSWVQWAARPLLLLAIPLLASNHTGTSTVRDAEGKVVAERECLWSPYYRIDYERTPSRAIQVNLIGHQQMISREASNTPAHAYALPHALNRDAGGAPFQDVLVIGAGSGNDVSRALQWGARHVDAVEIDPVIYRLGRADHPDHPYDDPRVTVHLDDGRNYLRATDQKYDLVVYALVDSLVLHSSYSNIRLESYLFTRQAFEDVRRRLKPGGVFMVYNYFRQGWIVARLNQGLREAFAAEPLVLSLPYQPEITPGENLKQSFTLFVAGDTGRLAEAFARSPEYWLKNVAPNPDLARCPNGFTARPGANEDGAAWSRFGLARVVAPAEALCTATDDWPFLYLRGPMVPTLSLRGILLMGVLGLGLLVLFRPRGAAAGGGGALGPRMFFLGASFMLVETKAVVHMALLFGGTWVVNSVVFFAVLVMILLANLYVLTCRPRKLWPYYVGLLLTLALNVVVPLDSFLGMGRVAQVACSCLLVFAPILFAGVIFAVSFGRSGSPDRAFGWNIAGAMVGGLAENTSMLLGFQYLLLVAVAFYLCSLIDPARRQAAAPPQPRDEPGPATTRPEPVGAGVG